MSLTSTPDGQAWPRDFWRPVDGRAATRLREDARAIRVVKDFMIIIESE
jgi:hypothetical protein